MTDEPAVFVVDDDPSVRRSVVRLLETAGLRVEEGLGRQRRFWSVSPLTVQGVSSSTCGCPG